MSDLLTGDVHATWLRLLNLDPVELVILTAMALTACLRWGRWLWRGTQLACKGAVCGAAALHRAWKLPPGDLCNEILSEMDGTVKTISIQNLKGTASGPGNVPCCTLTIGSVAVVWDGDGYLRSVLIDADVVTNLLEPFERRLILARAIASQKQYEERRSDQEAQDREITKQLLAERLRDSRKGVTLATAGVSQSGTLNHVEMPCRCT